MTSALSKGRRLFPVVLSFTRLLMVTFRRSFEIGDVFLPVILYRRRRISVQYIGAERNQPFLGLSVYASEVLVGSTFTETDRNDFMAPRWRYHGR